MFLSLSELHPLVEPIPWNQLRLLSQTNSFMLINTKYGFSYLTSSFSLPLPTPPITSSPPHLLPPPAPTYASLSLPSPYDTMVSGYPSTGYPTYQVLLTSSPLTSSPPLLLTSSPPHLLTSSPPHQGSTKWVSVVSRTTDKL